MKDGELGTFMSLTEAAKVIRDKFGIKIHTTSITFYLNGKVTSPYKGRFMFYYADEADIKRE